MGRGHESDLRINDISVSRCHTLIKFKDGRFLLEDNTSKFGTLVLLKNRAALVPGFNKAVQIGRTVINFSVKSLTQLTRSHEERREKQKEKSNSGDPLILAENGAEAHLPDSEEKYDEINVDLLGKEEEADIPQNQEAEDNLGGAEEDNQEQC